MLVPHTISDICLHGEYLTLADNSRYNTSDDWLLHLHFLRLVMQMLASSLREIFLTGDSCQEQVEFFVHPD